jgi:hypothetical protein
MDAFVQSVPNGGTGNFPSYQPVATRTATILITFVEYAIKSFCFACILDCAGLASGLWRVSVCIAIRMTKDV